jgi:CheY-like chemotaxis protein/HPt (histidine-containing phosphotransfer) domain-containing protein
VLLVEDNPINQEVARTLLDTLGLTTRVAGNGADALLQMAKEAFDLVLMDIQMPVMDGYEATRQLRARGYSLPIIALTAAAMREDQQRALAVGMNDHLAKPIDVRELQRVLGQWLAEAPQPPAGELSGQPVQPVPALVGATQVAGMAAQAHASFDVQAALALLGGNVELYRKLIGEFLLQLEQDFRPLLPSLHALQADSPAECFAAAQQQVHSLKGVAGNLCLPALTAQASALDRLLKQACLPEAALLQAFATTLERTAVDLDHWLAGQEVPRTAASPASDSEHALRTLHEPLERMLAAIRNSEFIDEARLQPLGRQLPAFAQERWRSIIRAVDDFDFELAAGLLSQLLNELQERTCEPC